MSEPTADHPEHAKRLEGRDRVTAADLGDETVAVTDVDDAATGDAVPDITDA